MKKLILFAVAILALSFFSCNKQTTEAPAVDSCAVDSCVVIDTTQVDSVVITIKDTIKK